MGKGSWFNVIPFLNIYPLWAQIIVFLCVIIAVCVLIFAYPRTSQDFSTGQDKQSGIIIKNCQISNCGTGVSAPKDANLKIDKTKFNNNKKSIDIRDQESK